MHFSVAVGEVALKAGNEKESEAILEGRDIKVHGLRVESLEPQGNHTLNRRRYSKLPTCKEFSKL